MTNLWIIWRRNAKHVAGDLRSQIRNADKLFENILGQDVRVARLLDVIRRHVNVIRSQVQVRRGNRANSPFCFRRERLSFVV